MPLSPLSGSEQPLGVNVTDDLARAYVFGPFRLLPERQLLMRGETPVRIGGRALDILTVLVERSGEVVGKPELLSRVWPNMFVEESNLKVNMAACGVRSAKGRAQAPISRR